jgi:hypothetical protein
MRAAATANPAGLAHFNDGDLQYVAMLGPEMEIIRRTATELFSDTVRRDVASRNYRVAINGNQWDATLDGISDAMWGTDPVEASQTTPIGHLVTRGAIAAGSAEPNRFYVSYNGPAPIPMRFTTTYSAGQGNPPLEVSGMGGLGPLILNGLQYGTGNRYGPGVPAGAPAVGDPGPEHRPFLIQRNNYTYVDMAARGPEVGKVALAIHRESDMVLVLVQPDMAPTGMTLDQLRDKLAGVGTDDAVFLDGSDSAMLVVNGIFHVSQAETKNELTTSGLGFR